MLFFFWFRLVLYFYGETRSSSTEAAMLRLNLTTVARNWQTKRWLEKRPFIVHPNVAYDNKYRPLIMLPRVSSPDSLKPIHTWTHLALMTCMEISWVKDSQVAQRLCMDTPTQGLKACNSLPGGLNWGNLLDESDESETFNFTSI